MALKGFLASGFQKLIGASRIKGANEQWLGEPNTQVFAVTSNQITNTLFFGDNILLHAGGNFTVSASSIFATTPTFPCTVSIVHTGTVGAITISSGTGSGSFKSETIRILPKESARFFYDPTTDAWYTLSYTDVGFLTVAKSITNGQSLITVDSSRSLQAINLQPGTNAIANITTLQAIFAKTGDMIVLYGSSSGSYGGSTDVNLIANTSSSPAQYSFSINGDFHISKRSSITLMYDNSWHEISRTTITY